MDCSREIAKERRDSVDIQPIKMGADYDRTLADIISLWGDAILFRMEQQGLTRKDLEPILGSRSRVLEVLNRKPSLSLDMARKLHNQLNIPRLEC